MEAREPWEKRGPTTLQDARIKVGRAAGAGVKALGRAAARVTGLDTIPPEPIERWKRRVGAVRDRIAGSTYESARSDVDMVDDDTSALLRMRGLPPDVTGKILGNYVADRRGKAGETARVARLKTMPRWLLEAGGVTTRVPLGGAKRWSLTYRFADDFDGGGRGVEELTVTYNPEPGAPKWHKFEFGLVPDRQGVVWVALRYGGERAEGLGEMLKYHLGLRSIQGQALHGSPSLTEFYHPVTAEEFGPIADILVPFLSEVLGLADEATGDDVFRLTIPNRPYPPYTTREMHEMYRALEVAEGNVIVSILNRAVRYFRHEMTNPFAADPLRAPGTVHWRDFLRDKFAKEKGVAEAMQETIRLEDPHGYRRSNRSASQRSTAVVSRRCSRAGCGAWAMRGKRLCSSHRPRASRRGTPSAGPAGPPSAPTGGPVRR